jgi:hypothetical protein
VASEFLGLYCWLSFLGGKSRQRLVGCVGWVGVTLAVEEGGGFGWDLAGRRVAAGGSRGVATLQGGIWATVQTEVTQAEARFEWLGEREGEDWFRVVAGWVGFFEFLLACGGKRASVVEVLLGVEVRHGVDALGRGVETSAERGSSWALIDRLGRCEKSVEISRSLAGCGRHVDVVCTAGRDGRSRLEKSMQTSV